MQQAAKLLIPITLDCATTSPSIALTLPDDRAILDMLCDEELVYGCGPAGEGGGCGDDHYHIAQTWEALNDRLRQLGWKA